MRPLQQVVAVPPATLRCACAVVLATTSLPVACAAYEPEPLRDHERGAASGSAGEPSGGGRAGGPALAAGAGGRANAGSAGSVTAFGGSSASGAASGGAAAGAGGSQPSAGASGDAPAGTGGSSGGSGRAWTFDSGAEGWTIREQSPELATPLTEAPGALQLLDVPFSATKQFVDLAYEYDEPTDLRGRTLRATIQRTSGGFVGAQLYVYAGQWVSPGFESLSSGDALVVSLVLDGVTDAGFTPASVARIGIKLSTGSNESNPFSATSVELSEVTLD